MNRRLKTVLFLLVTVSFNAYAVDGIVTPAADVVTEVAAGAGQTVVNGLSFVASSSAHCLSFLTSSLLNGIKNSPEIAAGTAKLITGLIVLYGSYWVYTNVSVLGKKIVEVLRNTAFLPGNAHETNENLKKHTQNFGERIKECYAYLNGINKKVKENKSTIQAVGSNLDAKIEVVALHQQKQTEKLNEIAQEQNAQRLTINHVHAAMVATQRSTDETNQNTAKSHAIVQSMQEQLRAQSLQNISLSTTLKSVQQQGVETAASVQTLVRTMSELSSFQKKTHTLVQEMHDADIPATVRNCQTAYEAMTEQVGQMYENQQQQQQSSVTVQSHERQMVTTTLSNSTDLSGSGVHRQEGGFFAQVVNPQFAKLREEDKRLDAKILTVEQQSQEKYQTLENMLIAITNLLEKTIENSLDSQQRIELELERKNQENAQLRKFFSVLVAGCEKTQLMSIDKPREQVVVVQEPTYTRCKEWSYMPPVQARFPSNMNQSGLGRLMNWG